MRLGSLRPIAEARERRIIFWPWEQIKSSGKDLLLTSQVLGRIRVWKVKKENTIEALYRGGEFETFRKNYSTELIDQSLGFVVKIRTEKIL